jgi:outer membrane protein assembly factor BamB
MRSPLLLFAALLLAPLGASLALGHAGHDHAAPPTPQPGPSGQVAYQPPGDAAGNASARNASAAGNASRAAMPPLAALGGAAPGRNQEWAVFKGDPERTGSTPAHLPLAPKLRWQAGSGGGGIVASPSVANGLVVFAALDKHVYAVDVETGLPRWPSVETGGFVFAAPSISDGIVLLAVTDGRLVALNLTDGSQRWEVRLNGTLSASPLVVKGTVVEATESGEVAALALDNGAPLWTRKLPGLARGVSPVWTGGRVVVGDADGNVWALHALTGQTLWRTLLPDPVTATPAVGNGRLFVPTLGLACLDLDTGRALWRHGEDAFVDSSPAAANNMVVLGAGDEPGIEGLNALTGERAWFVPTRLPVRSAPVVTPDGVLAVSDDGSLLVMNLRNGTLVWTLDAGERVHGSPAVVDGKVLVGRIDGMLRAYGDEARAASGAPALVDPAGGGIGLLEVLPVAAVVGVPYLGARWVRRRVRRKAGARHTPLPLPPPPPKPPAPGDAVRVLCPRCSCRFGVAPVRDRVVQCPACGMRAAVRRKGTQAGRPGA